MWEGQGGMGHVNRRLTPASQEVPVLTPSYSISAFLNHPMATQIKIKLWEESWVTNHLHMGLFIRYFYRCGFSTLCYFQFSFPYGYRCICIFTWLHPAQIELSTDLRNAQRKWLGGYMLMLAFQPGLSLISQ